MFIGRMSEISGCPIVVSQSYRIFELLGAHIAKEHRMILTMWYENKQKMGKALKM